MSASIAPAAAPPLSTVGIAVRLATSGAPRAPDRQRDTERERDRERLSSDPTNVRDAAAWGLRKLLPS